MSSTAYEPESLRSLHVPHEQSSAARARRQLAVQLKASQVSGAVADDALLILSELVSNAVRHARPLPRGKLRVSWEISPTEISVAVTDGGAATTPIATAATMSALSGRGLNIVRQLASGWDVILTGDGTTVRAIISRAGQS